MGADKSLYNIIMGDLQQNLQKDTAIGTLKPSELQWPYYDITPGCVEGNGDHLLVPLDAVDGQLPGGGGGADDGGVIHDVEHGTRRQQAGPYSQHLPFEQE